MNHIVLVGRLTKDPENIKLESGKIVSNVILAVQRSYKNEKGEYDADFINCEIWDALASSMKEYCRKGDMLAVKGRLHTDSYEVDGEKKYSQKVVAERITFLQSKKKDVEEDLEV